MAPKAKQVKGARWKCAYTSPCRDVHKALFVFCIRADKSAFMGEPGFMCAGCCSAVYQTQAATAWRLGVGSKRVRVLPYCATVAYANARVCLERGVAPNVNDPQLSR